MSALTRLQRYWGDRRQLLMPRRADWIGLCVSLTGYLMLTCLLATAVAKTYAAFSVGLELAVLVVVWALLRDVAVYFGLAALFAYFEARFKRGSWATIPIAIVLTLYTGLSTSFLIIAGEQGSWHALMSLKKQLGDVEMVMEELVSFTAVMGAGGGLVAFVVIPVVAGKVVAKGPRPFGWWRRDFGRVRATAPWVLLCGVLGFVVPGPRSIEARTLRENSIVKLINTTIRALEGGKFQGYDPVELVSEDAIASWAAAGNTPNVVVMVLESTRYDHTSLAGVEAKAKTPNIDKLADKGLVVHQARAVVPHTTKSLVTLLCDRMPTAQRGTIEVTSNNPFQCLPAILRSAGYRTAFFQSAFGTFEQRPRLVEKFGFDEFKAWEEIRGARLGYLASSDASLLKPFRQWLGQGAEEPFMATMLTSATHHPYRLPRGVKKTARRQGRPAQDREDRYARLVEAEDKLVGDVVSLLKKRGVLDRTIIVIVGDHGEGFGDHGLKQHDNNFYEEGLRVPLVVVGPGFEPASVLENVSLVDLTPTLLARLGIPMTEAAAAKSVGHDILGDDFPGDTAPRYFACYSSWRCRGFVLGTRKLVYSPEHHEVWYFDLVADPDEQEPQVIDAELEALLPGLHELINAHRTRKWKYEVQELDHFGKWWCKDNDGYCRHPRAHKKKNRYEVEGEDEGGSEESGDPAQGETSAFIPAPDLGAPAVAPPG